MYTLRLFNSLLIISLLGSAYGRLAIGFIDDILGDSATGVKPVYTGGGWNTPPCIQCLLQPDASKARNGTWHDNTRNSWDPVRSVRFNFTGVALSIFCIVPNKPVLIATTRISLGFTVDGGIAGAFTHTPDGSSDFTYDFPVFSKDGLSNDEHTVELTLEEDSSILFDYVQYTFEDGQLEPQPARTVIGTDTTTNIPNTAAMSTSTPSTTMNTPPEDTSSSSPPSQIGNESESTHIDSSSFTTTTATSSAFPSLPPSSSVPSTPASNLVPETSTTNTSTATEANSSKNRLSIILGAVFGAILPAILIATICLVCLRRHRHRRASDTSVDFFPMQASATTIGTSLAVDVMETSPSSSSPILSSNEKRRDLSRNGVGRFQPQGASFLEFQGDENVPPPYHLLFGRNRQEAP